ncbi:dynamin family protein [Pseudomonas sp. WPR_5_2]|uniref:dynamin family protein n=1 Tax=Pseudomonas sp. WPR_5_2 TaxID=1907371 RepID=UPI000EB06F3B|nr:dynamin family protein [Pseudomonas sp. WPR_5_2]RKS28522.1 dynamin family protein [Pseudomonas sp. WPR_5_2]
MTLNTTPRNIGFTRSLAVQQHLLSFSASMMSSTSVQDGVLTARFVGEFSAGKTRLLRELFGDQIPPALFPISSLERQTRLPLEITYGDSPALTLIQREHDYSEATPLEAFAHFPERNELIHLDPSQHRLRLTINESRLILPNGDGYSDDKSPKRLFLIDTPGWNSGDDQIAEQSAASLMTGHHNLAIVYVSQAARLDGATNADHLKDFMSALAEADDDARFLGRAKLLMVITACPDKDAAHLEKRAQDLAYRLWGELDRAADELELDILCVDFQELPTGDLQNFRDRFWHCLLAPLGHSTPSINANPWAAALKRWPAGWDINPQLLESARLLERGKNLLDKARVGEEFVAGMNMYRLMGFKSAELREKVLKTWLRQLATDTATLKDWTVPSLPEGHPLEQWWLHYWQVELEQLISPVRNFFANAQRTINRLTPDIEDLQQYLDQQLAAQHDVATSALTGSFACLIQSLPALCTEHGVENRIATLLSLSLLQCRYEDYYFHHRAEFAATN